MKIIEMMKIMWNNNEEIWKKVMKWNNEEIMKK